MTAGGAEPNALLRELAVDMAAEPRSVTEPEIYKRVLNPLPAGV